MALPESKNEAPPKSTTPSLSNGFPPSPSDLPSQAEWDKALKLTVQDQDAKLHTLASLVQPDNDTDTVGIIFVRHFFCGLCQNYIESLSPLLTPETLRAHRTRLIIIGCGAPGMIQNYAEGSKTTFPIYTDHSREIYKALGMIRTLVAPVKKPAYVHTGVVEMGIKAFIHGVKSVMQGGALWEAGDISQVGGEWFVRNGKLEWGHRMPNTIGHMSAEEIWDVVKFRKDETGETQVKEGIIRAGTMEKDGAFQPPTEGTSCGCS